MVGIHMQVMIIFVVNIVVASRRSCGCSMCQVTYRETLFYPVAWRIMYVLI